MRSKYLHRHCLHSKLILLSMFWKSFWNFMVPPIMCCILRKLFYMVFSHARHIVLLSYSYEAWHFWFRNYKETILLQGSCWSDFTNVQAHQRLHCLHSKNAFFSWPGSTICKVKFVLNFSSFYICFSSIQYPIKLRIHSLMQCLFGQNLLRAFLSNRIVTFWNSLFERSHAIQHMIVCIPHWHPHIHHRG